MNPTTLVEAEKKALSLVRDFDKGEAGIKETLNAVIDYQRFLLEIDAKDTTSVDKKLSELAKRVERTLEDQPWKKCSCDICSKVGVEVIIFRSNNHNRRRGFHNLHVYRNHLKKTIGV